MKKYTIFIFLLAPVLAFCQEEKQKQLSLTWGAGSLIRQDLIFSPMIHRDFSATHFSIGYERKKQMVHNIEVSFSSFNPSLSEGSYFEYGEEKNLYSHSLSLVSIYYAMGRQTVVNEKFEMGAGAFFHPDIQVLNYVYGRTGPYFGYFASLGLGVFGRIEYHVNIASWLKAELRLPVLAWVARSPYLVNDDEFIENIASHNSLKTFRSFIEDGELTTLNKLQQAGLLVQYHYRFTKRVSAGAGYRFLVLHHTEPRNLLSLENFLALNVNFHF
jgi:hypothetical protein